jgi:hypothetical protein
MRRTEGWERVLDAEIEKARRLPFSWGIHDCVTWAANVVLAMTGEDLIPEFRGGYQTKLEAYRLILQTGESLAACVDARLARSPIAFARRGDVVCRENALAICTGIHSFFITEDQGLQPIKTQHCEMAWRVG